MPWPSASRPGPGLLTLLAALGIGITGALFQVIPVSSQAIELEALRAPSAVATDDPWARLWDGVPGREVPLSAQNMAPPFGGGTVKALTARALHDGERLYFLLEWADGEPQDTVNSVTAFADAGAVQFPGMPGTLPPFTMGAPGAPVNIWQWKALWQADMARGFSGMQERYPNTYVDLDQAGDDPLFKAALAAGNPLSQREHPSPVENLLAESFGTLTHAEVQDVGGAGVWREGKWRVLFVRALQPAAEGMASFAVGEKTNVAFAVWDGGAGDRNGQKSIAPFIGLSLSDEQAAGAASRTPLAILALVIVAGAGGAVFYVLRARRGAA